MKTLFACVVLTVVCLPNTVTQANGLIQRLPQDGSWVRYHMIMNIQKPQSMETSGTMTILSVGRETINNEPCRWIELRMKTEIGGMKINSVSKILVPEKLFEKGKTVSEMVIRGWEQSNDNEPRKLNIIKILNNGLLSPFLPDSSRKMKTLKEKKVIDFQRGKLEIDSGITSSQTLDQANKPNLKINTSFIYSIWSHDKIPFGTAEIRIEYEVKRGDLVFTKGTTTFILEDFGTGAKSALPDQN